MNRHDRRRALAVGSAMPATMSAPGYNGPTPTIRVLVIDSAKREVRNTIMRMHPDDFIKVLGRPGAAWAKLGEIDERIHIMLAGFPDEQSYEPGHRWFEQEFVVADENGVQGPVLHGRAVVFGFAPALKKAASTPVNPIWLEERVTWLDPQQAAQSRLRAQSAATLEDKSGEEGEAEQAGREGVPALPDLRPRHE